ncbi:MAG: hypothetical protein HYX69_06905 [Planctomycetia bacterium]|nr:hypothetical protein [Planctomycetia bacterium]
MSINRFTNDVAEQVMERATGLEIKLWRTLEGGLEINYEVHGSSRFYDDDDDDDDDCCGGIAAPSDRAAEKAARRAEDLQFLRGLLARFQQQQTTD